MANTVQVSMNPANNQSAARRARHHRLVKATVRTPGIASGAIMAVVIRASMAIPDGVKTPP